MRIQMQHLDQAKEDSRYSPAQYAMAMNLTGQTDRDVAISALYGMNVEGDWYNLFRRARKEMVNDTKRNRYKSA